MSKLGRDADRLSKDQKQLNTLLSILPGMFYRCQNDADWTMEFVSEGCLALTGYGAEDLVKNKLIAYGDLIHEDDRQRVWNVVQTANKENSRFTVSYRIISAAGEEKWVWEQGLVLSGGEAGREGVEGIITDITELIQTEQALSEREARLRSIFLAAPVGIGIVSNRVLVDVNDRICEITGYSKEELVGQKSSIFYATHEEFERVGVEKYQQIEEEGTGTIETQWQCKNDEIIDVLLSSTPIDPNDLLAGVTFTALDITARKQAEKDILDYTQRIEALLGIDNLINSTLEIDQVIDIILTELETVISYDSTSVQLLRDDGLEIVAAFGFRPSENVEGLLFPLEPKYPNYEVVTTKQAFALDDLSQTHPQFKNESNKYWSREISSWLGVPLVSKGKSIGMLSLERFEAHPFSNDEIRLAMAFANQAASALENARLYDDLQLSNVNLVSAYDATIEGWARALELRDQVTEEHARRVVDLTVKLAREFEISGEELTNVRRGALLHDVGKMGVPDSILQKKGKLTDAEWEIMRQHTTYAFEMLNAVDYLRPALDIPLYHHEKWDGSGYPGGKKGGQIPLPARIFAVVDVYDALLSDRPYRKAWSKEKVFDYIKNNSGTHFDPEVVKRFFQIIVP